MVVQAAKTLEGRKVPLSPHQRKLRALNNNQIDTTIRLAEVLTFHTKLSTHLNSIQQRISSLVRRGKNAVPKIAALELEHRNLRRVIFAPHKCPPGTYYFDGKIGRPRQRPTWDRVFEMRDQAIEMHDQIKTAKVEVGERKEANEALRNEIGAISHTLSGINDELGSDPDQRVR